MVTMSHKTPLAFGSPNNYMTTGFTIRSTLPQDCKMETSATIRYMIILGNQNIPPSYSQTVQVIPHLLARVKAT